MTDRHYGHAYAKTAHLDVADIARLVRVDIANLVGDATIPPAKYSVKIKRYSGGQSIDVTIKNAAFDVYEIAEDAWGQPRPQYTGQAREVVALIEHAVGRYNYDGSDSQTDHYDVRFYSHVSFDHATTRPAAEVAA